MLAIYFISVFLHVAAAGLWLGGVAYTALVVAPVMAAETQDDARSAMGMRFHARFRWMRWLCLAALVGTGTFQMMMRGFGWEDVWRFGPDSFGRILSAKILLLVGIVIISLLHDGWVLPNLAAGLENGGVRWRRYGLWISRVNLVLGLAVIAMAIMLIRGTPW